MDGWMMDGWVVQYFEFFYPCLKHLLKSIALCTYLKFASVFWCDLFSYLLDNINKNLVKYDKKSLKFNICAVKESIKLNYA